MHEVSPSNKKEGKEPLVLGREIVTFMGPEGSGKTTIANRLASVTQKPYISTGGILRDLAATDKTKYGVACRKMFQEHTYLDSQMFLEILAERFKQRDLKNGFILDGGLRTVEEVVNFQSVLDKSDRVMPVHVIQLRIPAWLSMERLVTGEKARKRDDDTVEGVFRRLENYYHQLGQRVTLLQEQENVHLLHVNAMSTAEETFDTLYNALKNSAVNQLSNTQT